MSSSKIILTGGGTAGHVTPNLALVPYLKNSDYEILYIGSHDSIESNLATEAGLEFKSISTGKLRRYFDFKNFSDPFRVIKGISEAKHIINEYKPNVVFSKGGYVGLPVVIAAWLKRIPVICHESDMTPGLANKLGLPFAKKVCCNFPETVKELPAKKAVLTGSPIRDELKKGNKDNGLALCNFTNDKPIIMVIGGSLGAQSVNEAVRGILPMLLKDFQVVHVCGKTKLDESLNSTKGYKQFEYVGSELKDLFAMADLIISRAGANSICEILSLCKPNILVPLSRGSRGDQILNAKSFEAQGYSIVVNDDEKLKENLLLKITELHFNSQTYIDNMKKSKQNDAISTIVSLINSVKK